jgi:hypothetical protein
LRQRAIGKSDATTGLRGQLQLYPVAFSDEKRELLKALCPVRVQTKAGDPPAPVTDSGPTTRLRRLAKAWGNSAPD